MCICDCVCRCMCACNVEQTPVVVGDRPPGLQAPSLHWRENILFPMGLGRWEFPHFPGPVWPLDTAGGSNPGNSPSLPRCSVRGRGGHTTCQGQIQVFMALDPSAPGSPPISTRTQFLLEDLFPVVSALSRDLPLSPLKSP